MDQEVIKTIKCHLKKLILLQTVNRLNRKEIMLLDVIQNVAETWKRVSEKNIYFPSGHRTLILKKYAMMITTWIQNTNYADLLQHNLDTYVIDTYDDKLITSEILTDN